MTRGRSLEERFLSKIHISPNGCWDWTAYLNQDGYGKIRLNGRSVSAHRVSYELYKGEILPGLEIDHLCRSRSCVNPDHLEQVDHLENIARGESPHARNGRKTHCKRGHEFTPENTYINPSGKGRRCLTCKRETMNGLIKVVDYHG